MRMLDRKLLAAWPPDGYAEARVHSVFKRAVNLEIEQLDYLVTLLDRTRAMQPYAIRLDSLPDLSPGQNLVIGLESAAGPGRQWPGRQVLRVDLDRCTYYDSDLLLPQVWATHNRMRDRYLKLADFLAKEGSGSGVLPLVLPGAGVLSREAAWIKPEFDLFATAYRAGDWSQVRPRAVDLLGYGTGMTPFMDDFFSGLVLCNRISHFWLQGLDRTEISRQVTRLEGVDSLAQSLDQAARVRTNRISADLLSLACRGQVADQVKQVLYHLFADREEDLPVKLKCLLEFGHSSGTDIASGILFGLEQVLEQSQ